MRMWYVRMSTALGRRILRSSVSATSTAGDWISAVEGLGLCILRFDNSWDLLVCLISAGRQTLDRPRVNTVDRNVGWLFALLGLFKVK